MTKITVAKGDGIGPEIMDATLKIIMAAGAEILDRRLDRGDEIETSLVGKPLEDFFPGFFAHLELDPFEANVLNHAIRVSLRSSRRDIAAPVSLSLLPGLRAEGSSRQDHQGTEH